MSDAAEAAIPFPSQEPSAPIPISPQTGEPAHRLVPPPPKANVKKRTSSKPKASGDQFAKIIELHKQGLTNKHIADILGINGQSVNGVLQNARRNGVLPPFNLSMRAPAPEIAPQIVAPVVPPVQEQVMPPMNGNHQQPAPVSSSSPQDDFSGGRPVVGASGGFTSSNQAVKYTVERESPPDGLLGTHYGSFSQEELGQIYGEGHYKVTKHDPMQKFPIEYRQKVAATYGPPRSPNQTPQRPQVHGRPFFQKPWLTGQPTPGVEEEAERPMFRPSYVRPEPPDRGYVEIAKQQQAQNTSAMETALAMMGTMHQQSLQQIESARKGGPDNMVTQFLREQQEITNRRWEEDRNRQAEARREEEEKHHRRQEEEQRRWERDQQAERDRHQRELERITRETEAREKQMRLEVEEREKRAAEERRFLLDLEEKKLQLVRQESEATQRRLEAELTRLREETKERAEAANRIVSENQEATRQHIEESQKQIQEQLDREREQLEREHRLKEKALDKQHELEGRMLEIQKENMQNSGGDQIFQTINTVIKEVSKGLEKVVDYKKLEIMTPEAQIAHVANKSAAPPPAPEPPPPPVQTQVPQPPPQAQPQPTMQEAPQGTAQPAAQPEPKPGPVEAMVENRMETLIKENLRKPFFQEVLKEWALHVENAAEEGSVDATTFANLYLEMMRDPRNDEGRQGCAAFATFMKPRSWKKMLGVFKDAIDAETLATFQKPEAEEFYKQFKAMVLEQITEYWEQFLAARQQRGAAPANGTPAAAAPVEPATAPSAQNQAPNGQAP